MAVPKAFEKTVEKALLWQFDLYDLQPLDAELRCLKVLALRLIEQESRTPNAMTAMAVAHLVVPAYLWKDHPYHDIFNAFVEDCLAGRPATLGVDLSRAADRLLARRGPR